LSSQGTASELRGAFALIPVKRVFGGEFGQMLLYVAPPSGIVGLLAYVWFSLKTIIFPHPVESSQHVMTLNVVLFHVLLTRVPF
jgi:hypothetical protein